MAQRTISTRLAVEGESQYRSAISSVNAELKNMQSALKMTESQYASNASSTEALTAKQTALNNLLAVQKDKVLQVEAGLKNAQKAEEQYAEKKATLTKKIEENNRALERLKNSTEDTSEEQEKLTKENEQLNAELQKNETYLKGARRAVTNWKTDLNKAKTAVNETENALNQNSAALKNNTDKSRANADAFNTLAAALVASGLKRAIKEITDTLIACSEASIEFESAMAGVQKTTNMSGSELEEMGQDIKDLATEIPITTTEFAKIVETAGQLGIQKENLVEFSTVMAALGVSTNMTSDEAATMLARFANVTQMSPDLYENLGSVVVDLGNNFATTEKEIVKMGQRLAAAGELAGLSEPQIMALATAMSSVGIEAEAGGTAMTQTLTAMEKAVATGNENLQRFAEISGMSAEQFVSAWESAPITAIQSFIEGLGGLEEQGESATLVLEDMGLSGIRQSNMLKSLATASGLLGKAVGIANTAWSENTALMTEAGTRYATTESKMTVFKNSVNNLKIAIGDQLNPAINEMLGSGTDIVQWATDFAEANEWLGPSIAAVAAALSVLLGFVTTAGVVIPLLTRLMDALSHSFLKSPIGLVAMGLSAVTAAAIALAAALPKTTKEVMELEDAMDKSAEAFSDAQETFNGSMETIDSTGTVIQNYIDRLFELDEKTQLTADEQAEYNRIVGTLKTLLPDVDIALDETTGRIKNTKEELKKGAEAWQEYARQQAYATIFDEQIKALTQLQVELVNGQRKLDEYNATATDGVKEYAAVLAEGLAVKQAYDEAIENANYDLDNPAVVEAGEKYLEAVRKFDELKKELNLTGEDTAFAEDMADLMLAISTTEEQIASQSEKLNALQEEADAYNKSIEPAAEKTAEMSAEVRETKETLSILGEGAADSMAELPRAVAESMAETQAVVDTAAGEISASVENIGTQSAAGFEAGIGTLGTSASTAMAELNETVKANEQPAYDAGHGVGGNISAGIAAGLESGAGSVASAAAKVVREAIIAANKAGEIASPSKATRRTGRWLDEGIIAGIRDRERAVTEQMHSTMKKVVSVQVKAPEIPDHTDRILSTIQKSSGSSELSALLKLLSKKKELPKVEVTQNIYAEDTSYSGQQKAAGKELTKLARKLGR